MPMTRAFGSAPVTMMPIWSETMQNTANTSPTMIWYFRACPARSSSDAYSPSFRRTCRKNGILVSISARSSSRAILVAIFVITKYSIRTPVFGIQNTALTPVSAVS